MREFLVESQERGIAVMLMCAAVAVLGLGGLAWLALLIHRISRSIGEVIGALVPFD